MELYFEPHYAGLDKHIILASIVVISCLIGIVLLKRNHSIKNDYRFLGMMLLGFIVMISLGILIFSSWAILRLVPVEISDDSFTSAYGTVSVDQIRNTYITMDQPDRGLFQVVPDAGTQFLVVELSDGSVHILSEKNYPLREIKTALDQTLSKE